MAEEKKVVTLDDFEQRLMVSGLMDFRNDLLRDEKPTEDINDLILKVIDGGNHMRFYSYFLSLKPKMSEHICLM